MEKKEELQKRPAPVLYFLARNFFETYNTLKFHLTVEGVVPKGPAIVLSNHTSNQDYKIIVSACSPNRVSFLGSYHWFTFKKFNYWLNRIGVIPKHQFATDFTSIKKMRYVLQNKGIIYIAPEGTIYANGKLGYMSPSIAKLIRSFKVPVYTSLIEGAGLGNAKWSLKPHNNHISVTTNLLFTKEQISELTVAEIMEKLSAALSYNDFEYQKRKDIHVPAADRAEGFDTMFYKCPACREEFTLKAQGNTVECTHCHAKATILDTYRFKWNTKKQYFDNYVEWYDWQLESLRKEMEDPAWELREEVELAEDQEGKDNYVKIGKGIMTFSRDGWTYSGTKNGEFITDHDDCRDIFLATLKIGKHFELPIKNGHCRVYYPIKDGRTSMKWHLASRAMAERLGQ